MIAQWENDCTSLFVLSVARTMIAQGENDCTSLSVLSVAWTMIAQWENDCTSLFVLSVAWTMIAQWENECISQPVFSMARAQFLALSQHGIKWFNLPLMAPHNLWTSTKAYVQPRKKDHPLRVVVNLLARFYPCNVCGLR